MVASVTKLQFTLAERYKVMKMQNILGKSYIELNGFLIPYDRAKRLFHIVYPAYIKTFRDDNVVKDGFNRFVNANADAFQMEEEISVRVFYLLVTYVFYHWETKRRVLKREHTEKEWQSKIEEYKFCCAYCGKHFDRLEKDHVMPVSKGGTDEIKNIVPACRHCNAAKHDKLDYPPKVTTVTIVTL